jgi:hypothetical protein
MTKPRNRTACIEESFPKGPRMNIVFDMTYPRRLNTGTTVYANELVAAIGGRDTCSVTCLAETPPGRRHGIWKLWNGIRSIFWIQVVLPVKLLRLKADLLHAPSFFAPVVWCPCPIVLTVHDTLFLTRGCVTATCYFLCTHVALPQQQFDARKSSVQIRMPPATTSCRITTCRMSGFG